MSLSNDSTHVWHICTSLHHTSAQLTVVWIGVPAAVVEAHLGLQVGAACVTQSLEREYK